MASKASSQLPQHAAKGTTSGGSAALDLSGGRFDFDDGGTYCGGWEEGKAHGHGVCTGPKGQGEYAGAWHFGFEVSGVYTWPSGSTYEGHWQNGKRHGLGVEARGRWLYRGEWTQGFKGRYGVRQSTVSMARYEGTWANGLQDGYGSETYADGGTYQGQWLRGMRHGYGVRTSAPFGLASKATGSQAGGAAGAGNAAGATGSPSSGTSEKPPGVASGPSRGSANSLNAANEDASSQPPMRRGIDSEARGGFVLRSKSDDVPHRRRSLVERTGMKSFVQKLKKQRSTGDLDRKGVTSIRSTGSTTSWMSSESGYTGGASVVSEGSNQSFVIEDHEQLDPSVTETYMGEWKNDKRSGFGISERSDGLKYEGEWYNNRKYGYGITTFRDGSKEEGKYKNNILITSNQKRHLFLIRSAKFRERIDSALNAASRASKIALQKADIAISRTATARGKAEQSDIAATHAREDGQMAVKSAQQYQNEIDLITPPPNPSQLRPEPLFQGKPLSSPSPFQPARAAQSAQSDPSSTMLLHSQQQQPNTASSVTSTYPFTAPQQQHHQPSQQQIPNHTPPTISLTKPPNGKPPASPAFGMTIPSSSPIPPSADQFPQQRQLNRTSPQPLFGEQPTSGNVQSAIGDILSSVRKENRSVGGGGMQQPQNKPSVSSFNCDINVVEPDSTQQQQRPSMSQLGRAGAGGGGGRFSSLDRSANNPTQQQSQQQPQAASSSSYHQQTQDNLYGDIVPAGVGGGGRGRGGGGPSSAGGYNFQRIMDDHFEHYRRPPSRPPSREASVDRMPTALAEAMGGGGSRPPSRPASRTRTRTPMLQKQQFRGSDDFKLNPHSSSSTTANGKGGGHGDFSAIPSSSASYSRDHSAVRYRAAAAQQQQEIQNLGTVPKRTESLYMKYDVSTDLNNSGSNLQRKKSLPDVQNLESTTAAQGSREMTREEISVLSSSRRDNVRRQMEELERYKHNPLMYIINPRVQDWISRQQLMLLVLFVNMSLAFMFFKLLT